MSSLQEEDETVKQRFFLFCVRSRYKGGEGVVVKQRTSGFDLDSIREHTVESMPERKAMVFIVDFVDH